MNKRITVPEDGIETLFGSYDENLKHLESLFNVRIRTQGHELVIDGDAPGPDNVDRVVGHVERPDEMRGLVLHLGGRMLMIYADLWELRVTLLP